MKQLQVENGEIHDANPDRCPECGRPLERIETRGDATAYVHRGNPHDAECLV